MSALHIFFNLISIYIYVYIILFYFLKSLTTYDMISIFRTCTKDLKITKYIKMQQERGKVPVTVHTSCVSLLLVTGLFSLFSSTIWRKCRLGTSLMMCHFTGKKPFHLSWCQKSMFLLKSTRLIISATPQNWPLEFTWSMEKIEKGG